MTIIWDANNEPTLAVVVSYISLIAISTHAGVISISVVAQLILIRTRHWRQITFINIYKHNPIFTILVAKLLQRRCQISRRKH